MGRAKISGDCWLGGQGAGVGLSLSVLGSEGNGRAAATTGEFAATVQPATAFFLTLGEPLLVRTVPIELGLQ